VGAATSALLSPLVEINLRENILLEEICMLQVGTRVMLTGIIKSIDDDDKESMPYYVELDDGQVFWFGDKVCKPLESVESANLHPPTTAAQNSEA
jgi:tartrate dehydratase beta subunit/fumarate hydratase class I family protein